MKLLLTSAGSKNTSIHDALVRLLGRPIAESSALCIPTASYAQPMAGPLRAWNSATAVTTMSGRSPMVVRAADCCNTVGRALNSSRPARGEP